MTPGESLTPYVLFPQQESYLLYIDIDFDIDIFYIPISFLNLDYKMYDTILKGYFRYKTDFCYKITLDA